MLPSQVLFLCPEPWPCRAQGPTLRSRSSGSPGDLKLQASDQSVRFQDKGGLGAGVVETAWASVGLQGWAFTSRQTGRRKC